MSTLSTSYTFDFEMCFARQRRALFRHFFDIWTSKSGPRPSVFNTFDFERASRHNGVHFFDTFSTSEPPKVVRDRQFLTLLTSKCGSRHNGMHFFDISTSKSGPRMVCFVRFDFKMCFVPQRRALFRHLNFQKWSEPGVFCTFWLGNVLRATTACNFSSLIWPAGSAPAALASLLFDPPEPQIIGETQCSRLSYLFAHLHLLSSDLFSSDSFHLCFSTVHIVGSFTSKLPSISYISWCFSPQFLSPQLGAAELFPKAKPPTQLSFPIAGAVARPIWGSQKCGDFNGWWMDVHRYGMIGYDRFESQFHMFFLVCPSIKYHSEPWKPGWVLNLYSCWGPGPESAEFSWFHSIWPSHVNLPKPIGPTFQTKGFDMNGARDCQIFCSFVGFVQKLAVPHSIL